MLTLSTSVLSFPNGGIISEQNRLTLTSMTVAGPTVKRPVPDPLAVLSLDNRLFMWGYKEGFSVQS